jgi:hypothetical protein
MNMKRMIFLLVITMFSFICTHVSIAGTTFETPAWQKVKALGKQGIYTFLFYGDTKSKAGKSTRVLLNDVEKELNAKGVDLDKNNVNSKGQNSSVVDVVEVSQDASKEQELIKYFKLQENPTVLVVAPNEAITGYFAGIVEKDVLISSIRSGKELEIIKGLQEGQATFVCFYKENDSALAAIKTNLEAIGSNFKGAVNIIYASSEDKKEEKLRESFNALSNETAVFVLVPPGVIAAKLKVADVTKENLMKALLAPKKGGCCPVSSKKGC